MRWDGFVPSGLWVPIGNNWNLDELDGISSIPLNSSQWINYIILITSKTSLNKNLHWIIIVIVHLKSPPPQRTGKFLQAAIGKPTAVLLLILEDQDSRVRILEKLTESDAMSNGRRRYPKTPSWSRSGSRQIPLRVIRIWLMGKASYLLWTRVDCVILLLLQLSQVRKKRSI